MTLWAAFATLAAALAVVRPKPQRHQAAVVLVGLLAMLPAHFTSTLPDWFQWEFGVWILAAYLVDLVGDDAAPGTLLVVSATFYPLSAIGFNIWWCQFGANVFGLMALGVIGGVGRGLLDDLRRSRPRGVDFMGRVWMGCGSEAVGRSETPFSQKGLK